MASDKEVDSRIEEGSHCDFGAERVSDQTNTQEFANASGSKIDEALNQSVKELEMLERFYQQRGQTERAIEISLALRRMRDGSKKNLKSTDSHRDVH